jgi:hypothetical protein
MKIRVHVRRTKNRFAVNHTRSLVAFAFFSPPRLSVSLYSSKMFESLITPTISPPLLFSYCISVYICDAKGKFVVRLRFVGTDLARRALIHAYTAAESSTAPCAAGNSLAWLRAPEIAQRLATLGPRSAYVVANIKRTRALAVGIGRPVIPAQANLAREANLILHVPILVRRPLPFSSAALCSVARQWIDASALGDK